MEKKCTNMLHLVTCHKGSLFALLFYTPRQNKTNTNLNPESQQLLTYFVGENTHKLIEKKMLVVIDIM